MTSVLVLDDNADITTLLKMILEQWGFKVMVGRNGVEGLDLLSSATPDAIISNFRMPAMDGMTFLENVRAHEEWSSIPFVMISGLYAAEFGDDAMQRGANAYLTKPFRATELNNLFHQLNLKSN